jgi:hypothetical protein
MLRHEGKGIFIIKLPNVYAISINRSFNKEMFNMTVEQLYSTFANKDVRKVKQAKHNSSIFSNENLPAEFHSFKVKKLIDLYLEFIPSKYFDSLYENAKSKYSTKY